MDSIFGNNNFYNLSDPQATWLFDVSFYNEWDNAKNTEFINLLNRSLIITSVTLPTYHTEYVTKKYFGSERSFPVIRTYGGECTINFDVRSEPRDNIGIQKITQVYEQIREDSDDYIKTHPELDYTWNALHFDKVVVKLKHKVYDGATDVSINSKYEYINCIITDFGFNEELNYTSDSKLTCKLSFHYDYWTKTV